MSYDMFREAIQIAKFLRIMVTIGGGEPTIHPMFEFFLNYALQELKSHRIYIVTNGKHKQRAIWLAGLASRGELRAMLSRDKYHEPIDPIVVAEFNKRWWSSTDGRGIIRNLGTLVKAGRATTGVEGCHCAEFMVRPNGEVRQCLCPDAPVIGQFPNANWWQTNPCYAKQRKEQAKMDEAVQKALSA